MTEGGWKYAAASVIGASHQNNPGGVCQDFNVCRQLDADSPTLVAIVSDGAGSASHSQIGARCTCEFVDNRIMRAAPEEMFTRGFALDVLQGSRRRLKGLANEGGLALRDFACTLLVAIVDPSRAAFWQIGDGAICFRFRRNDTYQYAFWPEKGEYANVTFFVTDENAENHLDFDVTDCEIVQLAAFSDGLERLALDFVAGEVHSGFFAGLFQHLGPL